MNSKNVLLLLACSMVLYVGCKKKDSKRDKQYSTWIVNNHDTFRTNDVDSSIDCNPDHSYCRANLSSSGNSDRYALAFRSDYFPTSGNFELNTTVPGGQQFGFALYYSGKFYSHTPSRIDTMLASTVNGKASYNIPACWFVSYDNPTSDSILVQGVFNLP